VRRQTTTPHSAIPTNTETHNLSKGRNGRPWALRDREVELTGEREADSAALVTLFVHLESGGWSESVEGWRLCIVSQIGPRTGADRSPRSATVLAGGWLDGGGSRSGGRWDRVAAIDL
jgi:hypothetical protein